jgi:hypothetical protein
MTTKLKYHTIDPWLQSALHLCMEATELKTFRLVGGTALSLYLGHRKSIDLDMFTDEPYGSVDFAKIDKFLNTAFPYVDSSNIQPIGFGQSYIVGENKFDNFKIDLYYTDNFIDPIKLTDGIRIASIADLIAMKVDIIQRGGRKKDFWDIHELMTVYTFEDMVSFHLKRYPYNHNDQEILSKFTDFTKADDDFDPICLKGKIWEIIKLDFLDFVKTF